MKKIFILILLSFSSHQVTFSTINNVPMYFCTAADENFYNCLLNLIGCIHKHNYKEVNQIAVFNLGLSKDHLNYLNSIEKVKVYELEMVHPDLLKKFDTRSKSIHAGKPVPGWYAWKAVAIKQALDMFPVILWIDAGTTILKPINKLFEYIYQEGYFLHNSVDLPIRKQVCDYPRKAFDLDTPKNRWILDSYGVEAGLMGFTKKMYNTIVYPTYKLAYDLRNFADDGTSEGGFGWSRHDTTIFSIVARLNGLKIHFHSHNRFIYFNIDNKTIPFHITGAPIPSQTHIFISRQCLFNFRHFTSFIQHKK